MSFKSAQKVESINQLRALAPEGVALPAVWLQSLGLSRQSLSQYRKKGYLLSPAKGVYAFPGTELGWQGLVLGLQRLLGLPVHVGGITALNAQGFAHYLSLGGHKRVYLWGNCVLPGWVKKALPGVEVVHYKSSLFTGAADDTGLTELPVTIRDWSLTMAGPERAILEVLSKVEAYEASFTAAAELYSGLTTLRPNILNVLLPACTNIKAKRLFCFLAKFYDHPWVKYVELDALDVGSGKRVVTKGGKLDKEFLITVPPEFFVTGNEFDG